MSKRKKAKPKSKRIFLDSNIIIDDIKKRNRKSRELIQLIRQKKWFCTTSYLTIMEVLNREQEISYIHRKISEGWGLNRIMKERGSRDLEDEVLKRIYDKTTGEFEISYKFIGIYYLEKDSWDKTIRLFGYTNISVPDCIQVATAIQAGCNIFVTNDKFLIKEINERGIPLTAYRPQDLLE